MRFRTLITVIALATLSISPVAAQKRQPTPEQRIDRLEKQVRQVQKQVFPKGQPADTAGIVDDPAATQDAVNSVATRLDAVERQLSEIVRQAEENGNRVAVMEAELARLRADQDRRLRALETGDQSKTSDDNSMERAAEAVEAAGRAVDETLAVPPAPRPKVEVAATTDSADPGEVAYDKGFQLWNTGKYDAAITSLNAMAKKYPDHRRVSWAHNLAGRAMLDKGQPRAAAEALLANYRRDPKGERAQDSLFYLGQSLVKLNQAGQACKAYAELEEVYGASLRAPLKASLPAAKSQAKCG